MNFILKASFLIIFLIAIIWIASRLLFFPTELKVKWTYSKHSEVLQELATELNKIDLKNHFVIDERFISNSSDEAKLKIWALIKKAGLHQFVNDEKGARLFLGVIESEGRKFGAWLRLGSSDSEPACEREMLNDNISQCVIDLDGPWYYSVDW
ncbi:hypothetical protein [Pleionea sediminis]|uniref:hypothetical protein n=1 Tax=Pleionea sediminis TaxID=2569479 RepID=UPI0011847BE1|nr:hypothetical protein [Pleionea sediminis]